MGILTRLADWAYLRNHPAIERRDALGATVIPWQAGKPTWPERNVYAYQQDALRKISLIFRCVGVTANAVGSAPIRVYEEDADGNAKTLPNHPMRQLMRRPNPGMRETRFLSFVAMVMAVSGFCVVEKVRSPAGRVVELYPMRSDWLRPIPRDQAPPDWEYAIPGYARAFVKSAADVIVFPYADRPDGSPTGMGPLEAALREYGLLNTMTDFVKAFFDGGAMPVYALVPRQGDPNGLGPRKRMTQAEADLLKAKWVTRYGGLNRAVEPAVLEGIEDVKKLSFDFNELAYTDLRDISEAAICQAFGVSPMLVDAMVGMKHATYSNKQEARTGFYEDTIVPLWARMDDILTLGLLAEFESNPAVSLEFDTSDIPALQEDRNKKATWLTSGYLGGGISAHTYHQELGLPKPPGNDFYLRNALAVEVPVKTGTNGTGTARAALGSVVVREIPANGHRALAPGTTVLHRLPVETRARIGAAQRTLQDRLADAYDPKLRAFWAAQAERVIDTLDGRASADALETREAILRWSDETRRLADVLTGLHVVAGEESFKLAADLLGVEIDWSLSNPRIVDLLTDLGKRIADISETTRLDVSRVVTDGLGAGKTLPEIAADVRTLMTETYRGRAMTVARTESQISLNLSAKAAYRESGVVSHVELLDSSTHCEGYGASDGLSCCERNGLITTLDRVDVHVHAEHPNGSLAISPILSKPMGEE